jgi:hypothetical protein
MLPRWLRALSLQLLVLLATGAMGHAQQPGVLRLPWEQWQMHIGDDPRCAAIHASGCTVQKYFDDVFRYGIEWQRIEVTLPPDLRGSQQLGLLVQSEQPVYEVFVNGHFMGGSGSFATHQGPQDSRKVLEFPSNLAVDGHITVAIRELNMHVFLVTPGFVSAIAPLDEMQRVRDEDTLAHLRRSWQHYLCFAAMGCAGLVFFLLFAVNTRLREYFWLGALLTLLMLFRTDEFGSVIDIGMPSWLGSLIYNVGNGLQSLIVIEFVFAFLARPVPKFFRMVQFTGALVALNFLPQLPFLHAILFPLSETMSGFLMRLYFLAIFIAVLSQFLLIRGCLKSKLAEMRWIGGAVLFLTVVEAGWQAGWSGLPTLPMEFQLGAVDFDLRPVAWVLFAIVMLIAMTFRLRRIQDRNREVEQEMAAARGVQQILIPDQFPTIPGLRIESAYLPAKEVGGDFLQIVLMPNSADPDRPSAFIVLGDVSGKGLKAAMTVSLIVGTLRASAKHCTGPAELLGEINRSLIGRSDGFATCLALAVKSAGKFTLANAGHPNPYLNGDEVKTEANLPLGIDADVHYSEITFELDPDQLFTLVTDGVVEATGPDGELYGFERTRAISRQPANAIADAARQFGQEDDITVLTLTRESVGASASTQPSVPALSV